MQRNAEEQRPCSTFYNNKVLTLSRPKGLNYESHRCLRSITVQKYCIWWTKFDDEDSSWILHIYPINLPNLILWCIVDLFVVYLSWGKKDQQTVKLNQTGLWRLYASLFSVKHLFMFVPSVIRSLHNLHYLYLLIWVHPPLDFYKHTPWQTHTQISILHSYDDPKTRHRLCQIDILWGRMFL